MSRTAQEILKEIDMKTAFFVDNLKIPVKPEDITIFINEQDYEIISNMAISYFVKRLQQHFNTLLMRF